MKKFFRTLTQEKLRDRLFLFRLFATVIAIDFIAFISLGSINPLQLLNPARFLFSPPTDSRAAIELYFPKSFYIEKADESEENLKQNIIAVKQRSYIPAADESKKDQLITRAHHIIHQLILGPQLEVGVGDNALQAKKFVKDKQLIQDIWFYEGELIIKPDAERWQKLSAGTQQVARLCIEKSLMANIKEAKKISFSLL